MRLPDRWGLYEPSTEHDACGIGFVAHIQGHKSRDIVEGLLGCSHEELRAGFADGTFWPTGRPRFAYMEEMLR